MLIRFLLGGLLRPMVRGGGRGVLVGNGRNGEIRHFVHA